MLDQGTVWNPNLILGILLVTVRRGRADHLGAPRSAQRAELLKDGRTKFESAVLPELPVLYRVARRLGVTPEEAEDLVQSTVYKAYRSWGKFDGQHLRSWLIQILRNEKRGQARMASKRPEETELSEDCATEAPFWGALVDRLDAEKIREAIERLNEPYRMAVHLCDIEGMSYEEAALALDVPIGTVRSRLFRGRIQIRNFVLSGGEGQNQ